MNHNIYTYDGDGNRVKINASTTASGVSDLGTALDAYKTAFIDPDIAQLAAIIGVVANLDTVDKVIVGAINEVLGNLSTKLDKVVPVEISSIAVVIASVEAGRYYKCINDITSLNVTSYPASSLDEAVIEFTTGATIPTITFPAGAKWMDGVPINLASDMRYVISIRNSLIAYGRFIK